jgi:hypothetical protein
MKKLGKVLISWIAVNNDPYEQDAASGEFRFVDEVPVTGPTLTVLFDKESLSMLAPPRKCESVAV